MRRNDREVTDPAALDDILRRGSCLHLSLMDGDFPYIIPLNYGYTRKNGQPIFYFHSAPVGKKLDLIRKNPNAAFCVTLAHRVIPGATAGSYSFAYESVAGTGTISMVEDLPEKEKALAVLFSHYAPDAAFSASAQTVSHTAVFQLTVQEIWGKHHG